MKGPMRVLSLAFVALLGSACASDPGDMGPGGGGGPGVDDDVGGAVEDGLSRWSLVSDFDLSVTAAIPGSGSAVELLLDFHESPSRAIIALIKDVPGGEVVGFIDALPGFLKDRIYGWIDDAILGIEIAGVPVADKLGEIAAIVDALATDAKLSSELEVEAIAEDGDASARHRIEAVTFAYMNLSTTVTRGQVPEAAVTMTPLTATRAGAALTLTAHELGLPLGAFATIALDDMLEQRLGVAGGLDGVFAALIPCDTFATEVAEKCALGQCVGHEAELLAMCTLGLAAVGNEVEKRLHALSYAVRLEGAAVLSDRDANDFPDTLTEGAWDGEIQMGPVHEDLPGTFTGSRMIGQ